MRSVMLTAVKASCSVPVLCNPVELDGFHYMDGSLADSIPVKRAFEVGCDRVVCILTRKPEEAPTNYGKIRVLMRTYKKKYPAFYDTLMRRREMYAKQLDRIDRYEKEGKLLVFRPELDSISKFEQDKEKQEAFYQNGYDLMAANLQKMQDFLQGK